MASRSSRSKSSSAATELTNQSATSSAQSSDGAPLSPAGSSADGLTNEIASMRLASVQPDVPLPSIEPDVASSSDSTPTPTGSVASQRAGPPSVSINPPPEVGVDARAMHSASSASPVASMLSSPPGASASGQSLLQPDAESNASVGIFAMRGALAGSVSSRVPSPGGDDLVHDNPRRVSGSRRRRSSSRTPLVVHDVASEEPPDDPFNQPDFQKGFTDAKAAIGNLAGVLSSGSLHNQPDSKIRRLHAQAVELSAFQCPPTRTVGFVGNSGVGKSSLLNSLLDAKDLAQTSSGGVACTCVVTEYHYHDEDNFAIEVEWFTTEELHAQLTKLLGGFRRYYLHNDDMKDEDSKPLAKLAEGTFRAMFGGLSKINLLEGSGEDEIRSEREILLELSRMANEVASSKMHYRTHHDDLQACSNALMQLTSEGSLDEGQNAGDREPASWPYIKKIRWGIRQSSCRKG
jgi:hypothetical protein